MNVHASEADAATQSVIAAEFVAGTGALDVGSVAEVRLILILAPLAGSLVAAGAAGLVGLVHGTESTADVFQFVIDIPGHFGESDHEAQDRDGGNEDQFPGDDKTLFIGVELSEKSIHGC